MTKSDDEIVRAPATLLDIIVVGAGFGGVYAVHKFRSQGWSVLGLEAAAGVGGVWYHNRYPGARVDVDSIEYCYHFDADIYRDWIWSERYAAQPELLAYINFVADRLDIKRHFRFNTRMEGANWRPDEARWEVTTANGDKIMSRFLVMATGNLSAPRKPDFAGLDDFRGEWVQASRWPLRDVDFAGRRVGVIGTGSSGVQAIPVLAQQAEHLTVFQRSPNYSVPARNGPLDVALFNEIKERLQEEKSNLLRSKGGVRAPGTAKPMSAYTEEERNLLLEKQWAIGGHGMLWLFADQSTNQESNDIVANFVRQKIAQAVRDPALAEKLTPRGFPFGARRLCLDTDYYETYNRSNVTLVDVSEDAIETFTPTGIKTKHNEYQLDIVVFALGFDAFTGALDEANIRNAEGQAPTDHWRRGPRTFLGLMTSGFPNLFIVTGPGSPSVLSNLVLSNEHHVDWIARCIAFMDEQGHRIAEPSKQAEDAWVAHVAEVSQPLLRLKAKNYMVHVNADDDSRIFIPYAGGLDAYVRYADRVADNGFDGLVFQ